MINTWQNLCGDIMIQIRKGVFETNSSSTHTIAIDKSDIDKNKLPKSVHFGINSFGWDFSTSNSTAEYLWTAILGFLSCSEQTVKVKDKELDLDDVINIIQTEFNKYGIETSFDLAIDAGMYFNSGRQFGNKVYDYPQAIFYVDYTGDDGVDHGSELHSFVEYMLSNPENIVKFVINANSYAITGNDNDDTPSHIEELISDLENNKDVEIYQKYN